MLAALVTAAFALAPFDFFGFGPYDPAVPSPRQTLGIEPGARHTTYHEQDRVLRAIADAAPNRVRLIEYGRSTQGRPLRIAVISSERNLARLDDIRRDLGALADPRTDQDSSALLERTPAVVWINCTTHGDETASFESGQYLVYTLAASRQPSIQRALDEVVVVVNPAYNPDGHERFVTWYNSVAVGSEDPSAFEQRQPGVMGGRSNHYRFDLNRDRVAMSQVESRQEVAEVLRWNPQVYADQHGEVDTYFFPPCAMSVNVNLDRKRYEKWTEVFGKAHAQAFDEHGWLYFVRRQFDAYYPGYLDAWNSLTGAIGVTHETDGGSRLAIRRPGDRLITLRMGMEKHLTTALSLIETSAQRRKELLEDFATFKRDAKTGRYLDKMRRVLVVDRDCARSADWPSSLPPTVSNPPSSPGRLSSVDAITGRARTRNASSPRAPW